MATRNQQGHGPISPSPLDGVTFHFKDTRGPGGDSRTYKQRPGLNTHGQTYGQTRQRIPSKKKNSIWAKEEPKLDNGRRLRGIYHVTPEDLEFDFLKRAKKIGIAYGVICALQVASVLRKFKLADVKGISARATMR